MADRDRNNLTPWMQDKLCEFEVEAGRAGIPFIITNISRHFHEQVALFAQGRFPLREINILRKKAGMYLVGPEEGLKIVTWTLYSSHIIDLGDADPGNDKSRAFDVALKRVVDKGVHWDIKMNVNNNDIPDYEELARIGEKLGLVAGARFNSPDFPHFQQPEDINRG